MIVLGIDPGKTGALVLIRESEETGGLSVLSSTMTPLRLGKGDKPTFDMDEATRWYAKACLEEGFADHAVLENVHSMPKQGVASAFQFGRMFGGAEAFAQTVANQHLDRLTYVEPTKWKREMEVASAKKHHAIDRANEVFGGETGAEHWWLKKHDGVAEAALMAAWWLIEGKD